MNKIKLDKAKTFRILNLYERLNRGEVIVKKKVAEDFGISEKSVQRDIDDLRAYLAECYENGADTTVEYSYEHVIIGTRKEKPVDTGVSELVPFSFS